jgi:hypothetical protein
MVGRTAELSGEASQAVLFLRARPGVFRGVSDHVLAADHCDLATAAQDTASTAYTDGSEPSPILGHR